MKPVKNVIIMGAGGRDFHNFNVFFRNDKRCRLVAFTATQIPGIEGRVYPPELAGPNYPQGIPIVAETGLSGLIEQFDVDQVVFAYSDVSHEYVMHKASQVLAAGADFLLMGPRSTMLRAKIPVVSIGAVRTGSGKSQTSRRVADILRGMGKKVVVVRHPMPYGDLAKEMCQRFASIQDMDVQGVTLEEREEYEGHVERGTVVYAGVDYEVILRQAEAEADVIIWDGGNNDLPFYRPDVHIVVTDPLRAGHERSYHPGETNFRTADVIVINKVDTATKEDVQRIHASARELNPRAVIVEAASPVSVDKPELIAGKRVLVVEDGPTLTHGGMAYGAGVVAARAFGAAEIVDPRPYAVGSIIDVFDRYPHIGHLLPAMGYSKQQIAELEATIDATPADAIVVATPVNLGHVLRLKKPVARVRYELKELTEPDLADFLHIKFGD
ncbi:MAG: cyclic 2,3-diphosphoglycerate synthase [Dehalococcoidales bacterium]|nr:cyclic 2,3-diphosphoglycerate synthase [Dehalococcoidales bacterium]